MSNPSVLTFFCGYHCVKCVRVRSFSGTYFPAFGLNTERYSVPYLSVFSPNAGEYGPEKIGIRTLFHAVCVTVTNDRVTWYIIPSLPSLISVKPSKNRKALANLLAGPMSDFPSSQITYFYDRVEIN